MLCCHALEHFRSKMYGRSSITHSVHADCSTSAEIHPDWVNYLSLTVATSKPIWRLSHIIFTLSLCSHQFPPDCCNCSLHLICDCLGFLVRTQGYSPVLDSILTPSWHRAQCPFETWCPCKLNTGTPWSQLGQGHTSGEWPIKKTCIFCANRNIVTACTSVCIFISTESHWNTSSACCC